MTYWIFVIKKVNISMGSVLTGYGFVGVFYCRKRPAVNLAPHITLRDLEPAGKGTVSGNCNTQLALFTTERQRDLRPAVKFRKRA